MTDHSSTRPLHSSLTDMITAETSQPIMQHSNEDAESTHAQYSPSIHRHDNDDARSERTIVAHPEAAENCPDGINVDVWYELQQLGIETRVEDRPFTLTADHIPLALYKSVPSLLKDEKPFKWAQQRHEKQDNSPLKRFSTKFHQQKPANKMKEWYAKDFFPSMVKAQEEVSGSVDWETEEAKAIVELSMQKAKHLEKQMLQQKKERAKLYPQEARDRFHRSMNLSIWDDGNIYYSAW